MEAVHPVTTELAEWLRARLDDEERAALEAADGDSGRWFMGDKWNVYRSESEDNGDRLVAWGNVKPQSEHIADWNPARVLVEVEAKRQILDLHEIFAKEEIELVPGTAETRPTGRTLYICGLCDCDRHEETWHIEAACPTVLWLASVYADKPGFREEWRV